jgi:signal transduction histidine kinase
MNSSEQQRRQDQRAERVLDCIFKALGHDLSNYLVAVQGLLRILDMEEGDRLSPVGKDYLRRLGSTTQRAQGLVQSLRAIVKAHQQSERSEDVTLADLVREVKAEINQLFPDRLVEYHLAIRVPVLRVPFRGLRQVLVELLSHLVQAGGPAPVRLEVGSQALPDGDQLWVADHSRGAAAETAQPPPPLGAGDPLDGSLRLVLVRELVEAWGGRFAARTGAGQGQLFTLLLPARKEQRTPAAGAAAPPVRLGDGEAS